MNTQPEDIDEERLRQAKIRLALDELEQSENAREKRRLLHSRAFAVGVAAAVLACVFGWFIPIGAGELGCAAVWLISLIIFTGTYTLVFNLLWRAPRWVTRANFNRAVLEIIEGDRGVRALFLLISYPALRLLVYLIQ